MTFHQPARRRRWLLLAALTGVAVLAAVLLTTPPGRDAGPGDGPLRFPEDYNATLRPLPGPTFLVFEGCLEEGAAEVTLQAVTPQVEGDPAGHDVLVNWGQPSPVGAGTLEELPDRFERVANASAGTVAGCGESQGLMELAVTAPEVTDADAVVDGVLVEYAINGETYREVADVRFVSCADEASASDACAQEQQPTG